MSTQQLPHAPRKATLVLADGTCYQGVSFGAERNVQGEVVFTTAMNGYPESLTDPSYMGQIVVATYPMMGNYGIAARQTDELGLSLHFESEKHWLEALVVADYSAVYSHWLAVDSLGARLREEGTVAIAGVDTRALTKHLREHGSMMGTIEVEGGVVPVEERHWADMNLVAAASCKEVIRYGNGAKTIALVDCGVKHNIIRRLLHPDVTLVRVPWDYDLSRLSYDALFVSNGPGDPRKAGATIEQLRRAFAGNKPAFGICMGNQLFALAAGANLIKLKYGHRSHNQPVQCVGTEQCYITSQNHSYAVDSKTIPSDWREWFINLNDHTNEGLRHADKPFFSVQFHPEAAGGPTDTFFLFEDFLKATLDQK